jgi:hypothetical protein
MGEFECCSSVFSGHGGEVPILESRSIVVLEMHSHFLGSMFVIVVDVGNAALRRQVVGSHIAGLYEMYGGG